jgi:hypothetical protein
MPNLWLASHKRAHIRSIRLSDLTSKFIFISILADISGGN